MHYQLRNKLLPTLSAYSSLIMPIIKQIDAKRIIQIGVDNGALTEKLLQWVESKNGELDCIDLYSWVDEFKKIIADSHNINLLIELSEEILPQLKAADAYIIDGDHNYYTVLRELELSWKLSLDAKIPYLAFVRGLGWPFGHRDAYGNPNVIPKEFLKPFTWLQGIAVDYPTTVKNGYRLNTMAFAIEEGGDRNGVKAAVWDFLKDKKNEVEFITRPSYNGLGLLYSKNALWSEELTHQFKKNSNILLNELEENRIELLVEACQLAYEAEKQGIQQQNKGFDTDDFCQRMLEEKGKKSGLGLVSIIIPSYNRPQLLMEAIKSALNQTYKDIEVIVINDAGEDITSLIESFQDKRLIYLKHETNKGLPAARNTAIKHAQGKYIAYLDDDDLYYSNHIEILINGLVESQFSAGYTSFFRVRRKNIKGEIKTYRKKIDGGVPLDKDFVLISTSVPPVAIFHEKACLEKTGFFDETLKRYEDWDLWIRLAQEYPFLRIPIPTAEYTVTEEYSQMITSWGGFFLEATLRIHERYQNLVMNKPALQVEQKAFRDKSRLNALLQLEKIDKNQIAKLNLKETMENIIKYSLLNGPEDLKGAYALLWHLVERFPEDKGLASIVIPRSEES